MKIYKSLVKILAKDNSLESYRLYLICKNAFYTRSGLFSLNDLMDVLHVEYNYKSLGHQKGNKRHIYKDKLRIILKHSILFQECGPDLYRFTSEKALVNVRRSSYITIQQSDLMSLRAFNYLIIGCLAQGGGLKSYKSLAKQLNVTDRYCQIALKKLNEDQRVIKKQNHIVVQSDSNLNNINRMRVILQKVHGISTPSPIQYKREWYLLLYAPNSYFASNSVADKHISALQHPTTTYISHNCWFKNIFKTSIEEVMNGNPLLFNSITMEDYIESYSRAKFMSNVA